MRLTIDLRFSSPPQPSSDDERVVTLLELAQLSRAPRALWRLLRGSRYSQVRVLHDDIPLSGVQAGGLGLAALAKSDSFETVGAHVVASGQAAFVARSVARFVPAMGGELLRSVREHRRAARVAARPFDLPMRAGDVRSISYLRAEPSLRWLGAQVGGAATHTAGVINGFVAAGIDLHAYAAERPEGVGEDVAFTAVPPRRLFQLAHWLTLTDYTRELARVAAGRPADVVYQRYALGSYAGLDLARRLGVPLILEFNGSEIWATRHWGNGRLPLEGTLSALERRNLLDAALVVVTSDVLRDDLVADGIDAGKVLVNPNGVDVDRLAPLREGEPAARRARLGREEAPTIGFIGTFGMWHGVKVLPTIIEAVAAKRPDARWILVGDGPLRDEVAADIAARGLGGVVDLTGVVPHDRAVELLASCDVCVSPHVPNPDGSRFFGSPTKLFEYMGLGKPIVASDLDQIGDVLDHERSALLCEPGNAQAAADSVLRLLDDPELARRLGDAALVDATERYSWEAHTRRILAAFAAL